MVWPSQLAQPVGAKSKLLILISPMNGSVMVASLFPAYWPPPKGTDEHKENMHGMREESYSIGCMCFFAKIMIIHTKVFIFFELNYARTKQFMTFMAWARATRDDLSHSGIQTQIGTQTRSRQWKLWSSSRAPFHRSDSDSTGRQPVGRHLAGDDGHRMAAVQNAPIRRMTTGTVFARIAMSCQSDQFFTYHTSYSTRSA